MNNNNDNYNMKNNFLWFNGYNNNYNMKNNFFCGLMVISYT